MFTVILYVLAAAGLGISFFKDRRKTKSALVKAWRSFESILPQILEIMIIIGIALSILKPETVSQLLGRQSGFLGMVIAALIGSVTLMPGFVVFPLAESLMKSGAAVTQTAVLVSTLMTVGIVTFPVEKSYFRTKAAVIRNVSAFVFSFVVAWIIGAVVK